MSRRTDYHMSRLTDYHMRRRPDYHMSRLPDYHMIRRPDYHMSQRAAYIMVPTTGLYGEAYGIKFVRTLFHIRYFPSIYLFLIMYYTKAGILSHYTKFLCYQYFIKMCDTDGRSISWCRRPLYIMVPTAGLYHGADVRSISWCRRAFYMAEHME
jgi:hypothetical protein